MLIKKHIEDQSLEQEINKLIEAGKYPNIDALIERAIRNLVADHKHGSVNDPLWSPFLSKRFDAIDYKKVAAEYEKMFDTENNPDNLIKQTKQPYGPLSVGLVSHWHNRMLPIKWLLRQFLRCFNERELVKISHSEDTTTHTPTKWIDIKGFEDYILNKALLQIEFSLTKSPKTSFDGITSIAVGFPKIEKALQEQEMDDERKKQKMFSALIVSRARFFSIYFGKVITTKDVKVPVFLWEKGDSLSVQRRKVNEKKETFRVKGACFEMGFFECKWLWTNPEENEKPKFTFEIALTPLGLEFAKMENPLLDRLEMDEEIPNTTIFADRFDENGVKRKVTNVFTHKETKFILDNIYRTQNKYIQEDRFKLENEIVKKILEKSNSKVGTPITRKEYHDLFNKTAEEISNLSEADLEKTSRLMQHKSTTIMRLVELGLVYRGGQRSREIYVIQPLE